jgi:HK97 family phage major capsid protein
MKRFVLSICALLFALLTWPLPAAVRGADGPPPTNDATLFFEHVGLTLRRTVAYAALQVHIWLIDLRLAMSGAMAIEAGDEFEKEVLASVKSIQTKQDELVSKYDNLQKETKTAFEDFTKVKNNLNSLDEFKTSLGKVQLQLRREQRMAFGDPVRRISADDELRTRLNGLVRVALAAKDPQVGKIGEDMLKGMTKRTLITSSTPGSTFMTTDLANEIYDVLGQFGVWNTFAVQRVGTTTTKFPVTTAHPVALSVRKLSNRKLTEDSTLAGTSVDCDVVLWGVLLGVEVELLQDAEFDVTSYVVENFGQAMAYRFDHLCLNADGSDDEVDDNNTGVFHSGTAAACAAGNTTVETTDFEDWTRALTTVSAVVLSRPARWWIHPTTIARLLAVKDLSGRPMFLTATEAPTYGGIGSLLGYPITPSHAAPSANTASAKVAVFGDPRAHVFGLRTDFGIDASDDFAFDGVKRMFRGLARAGGKTRRATGLAVVTLAGS